MRGPLFAAGVLGLLLCSPAVVIRAQTSEPQLPPGEGREVVATLCAACHTLQVVVTKRDGPAGWSATVDNMVMRGSTLFRPGEPELATRYLTRNFGPAAGRMETGRLPPRTVVGQNITATSKEIVLPDGAGKTLVEQRCGVMCHDLGRVVSTRRRKDDWERIARTMHERAQLGGPKEIQEITSYLVTHFGQ